MLSFCQGIMSKRSGATSTRKTNGRTSIEIEFKYSEYMSYRVTQIETQNRGVDTMVYENRVKGQAHSFVRWSGPTFVPVLSSLILSQKYAALSNHERCLSLAIVLAQVGTTTCHITCDALVEPRPEDTMKTLPRFTPYVMTLESGFILKERLNAPEHCSHLKSGCR